MSVPCRLGAMLAVISIALCVEWTLLLIGVVYVFETASVMLQVSYLNTLSVSMEKVVVSSSYDTIPPFTSNWVVFQVRVTNGQSGS